MRIPAQTPAVARNRRSGPVRRSVRRWTEADGVRPSQYSDQEGDAGEEDQGDSGGDEGGEESGDDGGYSGDSTVESDV